MNGAKSYCAVLRFGTYEVDLKLREVRKHGLRLRLEEKPFKILELLLERPGEVVTRGVLRKRLWPDTTVGYENGLNTAVGKLRVLLGDSAQSPRFVETIPRRGYRFIAPVERPSRTGSNGRLMLVVLPFQNLGGDSEQEFFADGLTEEIIVHLGQLNPKRLGVIARTSAVHYKNCGKSIGEIAAELGADYVLEGSVRRYGPRVRITTKLIEAQDQTHLWSANYNREFQDILNVQQGVSAEVGGALEVELLPAHAPSATRPDPAAHEGYLRGRFFWAQMSESALRKAIECFEAAVATDPEYALAYSGIADCCLLLCWFGALHPLEAGPRAAAAATRAVELDASSSEAHTSLALARHWYAWDWKGAEEEFLRALELNASYATAHRWYAAFLNNSGRLDEAWAELQRARELDPLSLAVALNLADPFFYGRQFDRAIEHLHSVLEREPRFSPALFNLGRAHVQKGSYEEAIAAFEKAVQFSGNREGLPALAHAYGLAGRKAEARKILEHLTSDTHGRYLASPLLALVHLGLGGRDRAFDLLDQSVEERSFWLVMLRADPVYDCIRSDPRFHRLLERVGFPA
jgi:TolB-like protein/Flp pilus assembly protein TadD